MESLAASIVNRVLGEYISNLETNQLQIAIWEGNVVLKNLKVQSHVNPLAQTKSIRSLENPLIRSLWYL